MMLQMEKCRGTLMGIIALLWLSGGCGKSTPGPAAPPAPEVSIMTATPVPISHLYELPGRVEPFRVAEIRARVAGIVLRRHFDEGAEVKAEQVLFSIDPAPLNAALSRASGELAKAEATLFETSSLLKRYESLVKIGAVSQKDFDSVQAACKSAMAAKVSAAADVDTAKLNLDYATVRAPISGRLGRALVTEGALVGQNEATKMAVIQQINPIYVDFNQPVADALRLRDALRQEHLLRDGKKTVKISLTIDGTSYKKEGNLLFSDISVDRATGQISLRGQFENNDSVLLPGMYVRVKMEERIADSAFLIPQRAIQRQADGTAVVLIVEDKGIARIRVVKTGQQVGPDWQILDGLKVGDRVITGGMAKPEMAVTIKENTAK